jgi:hypothetical protein
MYDSEPYVYKNHTWWRIVGTHSQGAEKDRGFNSNYRKTKEAMWNYLNSYKTGGLADFTGPAWLDGTKSRPEYVLNADQTKRFFSLVDVLENYDKKHSATE